MGPRQSRTHSRYPVDLAVTVEACGRNARVTGRLVNLGEGGAACRLDGPLRIGEQVIVRITSHEQVVLGAEVAWVAWGESTSVRLGLRFQGDEQERTARLLENSVSQQCIGA